MTSERRSVVEVTGLPVVSVIIPTHARPLQVRQAVDSVINQDYQGEIECVIVHDGEEADASLESKAPGRVVRAVENRTHRRGLPGARNAGLEHISGALVASLDDDDRWLPAKARMQVELLNSCPQVLAVASGVILHTAKGRDRVRLPPMRVTREDLLHRRIPELHSSNLMVRREIFQIAGRYDEDVPIPEDYDWLLRLTHHTDVLSVPKSLVWVDRSRPLGSGERWAYRARGRERLLAKHPDLAADPRAAASLYGRIAFAHASAGDRWSALTWIGRAARRRPVNRWVLASLGVVIGIPAELVQRIAGARGRSL